MQVTITQPIKKLLSYLTVSTAAIVLQSHTALAAPGVDVTVNLSQWSADYSGSIGRNNNVVSLNELGLADDKHAFFTIKIKHALPVIPNFQFRHTNLDTNGSGTLNNAFTIDDVDFAISDTLSTQLDLSHQDFTFFYSPLNNWVQLDLGGTLRHFDGAASVTATASSDSVTFDEWLPMLYIGGNIELPFTGWSLNADMNYVSYDSNTLSDYTASIAYSTDTPVSLSAEIGYRKFSLDADDLSNVTTTIDIDGVYGSIGAKF